MIKINHTTDVCTTNMQYTPVVQGNIDTSCGVINVDENNDIHDYTLEDKVSRGICKFMVIKESSSFYTRRKVVKYHPGGDTSQVNFVRKITDSIQEKEFFKNCINKFTKILNKYHNNVHTNYENLYSELKNVIFEGLINSTDNYSGLRVNITACSIRLYILFSLIFLDVNFNFKEHLFDVLNLLLNNLNTFYKRMVGAGENIGTVLINIEEEENKNVYYFIKVSFADFMKDKHDMIHRELNKKRNEMFKINIDSTCRKRILRK